ncbi:hypothetical protein CXB49_11455 [Chromobacterium sp. ATCC 53434]|uniref:hypothetical protein n=1 Tax=Chromobacterium sp. (strain ATCC 53434 / SC 14030) TaxID=2059672 RepID=UPI000C75F9E5|nr:hypothetical protein [Chromobacterium sp. ATCC 53434]AUH51387.1 hypothetical protein CXB49_11455 [Chromobacterium sp. ATCC 53434]
MPSDVHPGPPCPQIDADALSGALPPLPGWLADLRPVAPRLPWPPRPSEPSLDLNQGEFARLLKQAGVCDLGAVPVPGACVLLPWGVALSERLAQLLREAFGELELDEYAYPQVVPQECFEPMADLLDAERCLLQVATGLDRAQGRSRGVLTPTGEQVIASHWRQLLSQPETLPIRLFQRARYFRPVSSADRSGKGVFAALEAADVFEFHCCHAAMPDAQRDLQRLHLGLARLAESLPLPQLVGVRPPWGNREALYEWAVGGDTPLPSGECVQTSALYFQGQRLSRRYDIGLGKGEQRRHAWQLDGFASRRMLYAQLFLSAKADGSLSVHPRLAPVQVAILARAPGEDDGRRLHGLQQRLRALGLRPALEHCDDAKALTARIRHWRKRGAPLLLLYFGQRHAQDLPRLRLYRTDTDQELELELATAPTDDADALSQRLADALADIDDYAGAAVLRRARGQIAFAASEAEARQALAARKSVIAPVCPTRLHTEAVAAWRMGELCSFAAADEPAPCIFSGRPTWARALLSRRI